MRARTSVDAEVFDRSSGAIQVVLEHEHAVTAREDQARPLGAGVGRRHRLDANGFEFGENSSRLDDTRNAHQFHDALVVAVVVVVAIVVVVSVHESESCMGVARPLPHASATNVRATTSSRPSWGRVRPG